MFLVKKIKSTLNQYKQNVYSYFRKLKMRLLDDKSLVSHLRPQIQINKKWYGNSYGGFYIHPDVLTNTSIVYSVGIGRDLSFDKKVMKNHKCRVYGFDPTPKSIEYINSIPNLSLFNFYNFGLATETGKVKFYLPKNKRAVSASIVISEVFDKSDFIEVEMKSFDDIVNELAHKKIDVLKIDIEGAEYDVLKSILESNVEIGQLLIEFHDRLFENEIKSVESIKLLNSHGFKIFGSSLNHEEISLINEKLI
jgi:FkbM family methyltransferase